MIHQRYRHWTISNIIPSSDNETIRPFAENQDHQDLIAITFAISSYFTNRATYRIASTCTKNDRVTILSVVCGLYPRSNTKRNKFQFQSYICSSFFQILRHTCSIFNFHIFYLVSANFYFFYYLPGKYSILILIYNHLTTAYPNPTHYSIMFSRKNIFTKLTVTSDTNCISICIIGFFPFSEQ